MEREQKHEIRPPGAVDSNQSLTQPAHSLASEAVLNQLGADLEEGLSCENAQERLEKYGANVLESDDGLPLLKIFIKQIANAMTMVSSLPSEECMFHSANTR